MTPAERAALRELVAKASKTLLGPTVTHENSQAEWDAAFIASARTAVPALLDDCERLERELESYKIRCAGLGRNYEEWEEDFRQGVLAICEKADRYSATPQWIADEVRKLDAEDARAKKEGGDNVE